MASIFENISIEGIALCVIAGVLFLYLWGVCKVSRKARIQLNTHPDDQLGNELSTIELERYARHIMLHDIGGAGQMRLRNARVLVIGAGGLGSPVLSYLAAAGVGVIGIVDDDYVSISNLQRQVLFNEDHLGKPKVFAAQAMLNIQNPFVNIQTYCQRVDASNIDDLVQAYDIIIDGSDSFETRRIVNAASVRYMRPFISGALSQWEGQVVVFNMEKNQPCYECIFPHMLEKGYLPTCAEVGVMGALPGIIGSLMASEAIKIITKTGEILSGKMLIFDALYCETRKINLTKKSACNICRGHNEAIT